MTPSLPYRATLLTLLVAIAGCQTGNYANQYDGTAPKPNPRLDSATSAANVHEGILRHELALPTGDRKTSAILVEMLAQDEARLNRPYDYRIRVTNLTDTPLVNVTIREKHRDNFEITKSQPPGHADGNWILYTFDELPPAASRTIEISGVAKSEGKLPTCIAVDYRPTLCTQTDVVNPVLKLTKEAPSEVMICEGIRYRYVVSNVGTGTEHAVSIVDQLPDGVVTEDGKKEVQLDVGDLVPGMSKERIVRVKPAHIGQFTSGAIARAPGSPEVHSQQVTTTVREPKLEVTLKGPPTEYLNKVATYTVTVKNIGDAPAQRTVLGFDAAGHGDVTTVAIADTAAHQGAEVAYGAEGVDLDTIPPGQTRTVTVNVRTTHEGPLQLTASAVATCVGPTTQRVTTQIATLPALRLEMVDLDDPIRVGDNVIYRVTVKNQGTGSDKNITLTATLPPELTYVSSTGATDAKVDGQTIHFATLDSLEAGKDAVWRIEAKANKAGDVLMRVQLKSDSLAQPATESEPTRLY